MLRDCPLARQVWDSLLPPFVIGTFYGINLVDWLHTNCNSNVFSYMGIPWNINFPFGACSIWLHRNEVLFKDNNPPKLNRAKVPKAAEFAFLGVHGKNVRMKTTIQVKWNPPLPLPIGSNSTQMGHLWVIRAVQVEEASSRMLKVNGSRGM